MKYLADSIQTSPFVLMAQPTLFDETRAPNGKHTAWGYCHVPNGSEVDMTDAIEDQIERFAPGFKDLVLQRNSRNSIGYQEPQPELRRRRHRWGSLRLEESHADWRETSLYLG